LRQLLSKDAAKEYKSDYKFKVKDKIITDENSKLIDYNITAEKNLVEYV